MKHILFTLLLVIGISKLAMAQEAPPEVDGVPIDGGASLLLAAGAGYGIKKYKEYHKRKRNAEDLD